MNEASKNIYLEAEAERVRKAKTRAQQWGDEVLTPLSITKIYRISPAAVRQAIAKKKVGVRLELCASDKTVRLIDLRSALAFWGNVEQSTLNEMRENGHTLFANGVLFNVLHHRPLAVLSDSEETGTAD